MRIMFTGAAAWANSGYSKPLRYLMPRLADECDRFAWFQWSYLGTETWAFGTEYNTSLWMDGALTEAGKAYKER